MKRSVHLSTIGLCMTAALILNSGCSDKDDLLLLPAAAMITSSDQTPGNSPTDGTDGSGDTANGSNETTQQAVGDYQVIIPADDFEQGTAPQGDFNGTVYYGKGEETAGFVGIIPDGGAANSQDLTAAILAALNADANLSASVVSSQPAASGDSTLLQLTVNTSSSMTVTGLSNKILTLVGTSIAGGNVSMLPGAQPGESSSQTFRVVAQVTYDSNGSAVLGIGVSTEANFPSTESTLTSLLDGTNIGGGNASVADASNQFSATGPAKADFIWVIDNSGSMSQEQALVRSNASAFFQRMQQAGLDFRMGVITTDSDQLRGVGMTSNASDFDAAVAAAGINGSGIESGVHFADKGLSAGGGLVAAGYPRAGATLTFIMVSDEGDHYANYNGNAQYDTANNIFTTDNHRVYSIIGLDASTGLPGTCSGNNGTRATASNNTRTTYYDLAAATGGASASICLDDYTPIFNIIAQQTAGAASSYVLTETPISSSISVKVNGATIARDADNGFTYNAGSNSITFSGTARPTAGAAIEVNYRKFE